MEITIDEHLCTGCWICIELCPEVFEMDAEGRAHALCNPVREDVKNVCRTTETICPVHAITIDEKNV
jgi:ferredoxin